MDADPLLLCTACYKCILDLKTAQEDYKPGNHRLTIDVLP